MFNYKIVGLDVEFDYDKSKINHSQQMKTSETEFIREIPAYDSDEREL